jgi:hypothetical protein
VAEADANLKSGEDVEQQAFAMSMDEQSNAAIAGLESAQQKLSAQAEPYVTSLVPAEEPK